MYLLIEPFNSGSHKQLIDLLVKNIPDTYAVTLPGKKWHWKARTSALYLSQVIPRNRNYKSIFASSVLNLAELIALRADLAALHKVLYFHENQLAYPTKKASDRDFQYGYNQILSSLVADVVLFNSNYNKESFLGSINTFLKMIPYERPRNIAEQLGDKCHVLYFPMEYPRLTCDIVSQCSPDGNARVLFEDTSKLSEDLTEDATHLTGKFSSVVVNEDQAKSYSVDSSVKIDKLISDLSEEEDSELIDNKAVTSTADTGAQSNESDMFTSASSNIQTRKIDVSEKNCCTQIVQKINSSNSSDSKQILSDTQVDEVNNTLDTDSANGSKRKHLESKSKVLELTEFSKCTSFQPSLCIFDKSSAVSKRTDMLEDKDDGIKMNAMKRQKITERDEKDLSSPLHIVWPHRWEHDKGPESFFKVLFQLQDCGAKFKLSVLGENYSEIPDIFDEAKTRLEDVISHWGYLPTKEDYYDVLRQADCVISTANHEFFGVAMLESVHLGCFPLCPNRLVYPEIFPKECLYNTDQQLFKKLREFCRRPNRLRKSHCKVDTGKYEWEMVKEDYIKYICGKK